MKPRTKIFTGIIAIILSSMLLFIAVTAINNNKATPDLELGARTVKLSDNSLDLDNVFAEFDSVEKFEENNVYTYIAKKTFDKSSLSLYDEIDYDAEMSLESEEVEYSVSADATTGSVVLSAMLVENEEQIIDTLPGNVLYNEQNEVDVIFSVDGEMYSAREMLTQSAVEQCSLIGNILHASLNVALKVLAAYEFGIKITLAAVSNVSALLLIIGDVKYRSNYNNNSAKIQPTDFVTDQRNYSDWDFGISDLAYAGCEVIAGYNLARAKNININLAQTTYLYESLGIEIGFAAGYLGSNPYQISYYLNALGIKYTTVYTYSALETKVKNDTQYHMIVSRWNTTAVNSKIHTYYVDKISSSTMETYNMDFDLDAVPADSASQLFNEKPKNTFIVAYLVEK